MNAIAKNSALIRSEKVFRIGCNVSSHSGQLGSITIAIIIIEANNTGSINGGKFVDRSARTIEMIERWLDDDDDDGDDDRLIDMSTAYGKEVEMYSHPIWRAREPLQITLHQNRKSNRDK